MTSDQLIRSEEREEAHEQEPTASSPSPTPAARRGPSAASIGWGIAFLAAGLLWIVVLLDLPVPWEYVLPTGVILVGIALLAGVRGPLRGGLAGFGTVLAIVAVVAMIIPTGAFTAGDRTVTVATPAELGTPYELGAGVLTIDLRDVELPQGTTQLSGRVNFGELVLIVPPDVSIAGDASVRIGEVQAFGRSTAGVAPSMEVAETVDDAERTLWVDLEVGFGRIEVRR